MYIYQRRNKVLNQETRKYLPHYQSDKGLKGIGVNQALLSSSEWRLT